MLSRLTLAIDKDVEGAIRTGENVMVLRPSLLVPFLEGLGASLSSRTPKQPVQTPIPSRAAE